jgi:DNA-binding response OmpR family regulator
VAQRAHNRHVAWFTNNSAARSATEPSVETLPLTLAREDSGRCPGTLRPPRIALCGNWRDVQELCELLSDRARLTWYGDPNAIGAHDLVVYVDGDSAGPWSPTWVREARSRAGGAPVLVITRGASPQEAARFMSVGALDCIEATMGPERIVARVLGLAGLGSGTHPACGSIPVEIDPALRTVRIDRTIARVTTTELLIFQYLYHHADTWKTAGEILQEVLGSHHCPHTPVVRVHMFRLRRALGEQAACVESHQGKGYRFTLRRQSSPPPARLEAQPQVTAP